MAGLQPLDFEFSKFPYYELWYSLQNYISTERSKTEEGFYGELFRFTQPERTRNFSGELSSRPRNSKPRILFLFVRAVPLVRPYSSRTSNFVSQFWIFIRGEGRRPSDVPDFDILFLLTLISCEQWTVAVKKDEFTRYREKLKSVTFRSGLRVESWVLATDPSVLALPSANWMRCRKRIAQLQE